MARNFIYSTLTSDMTYAVYRQGENDLPEVDKKVYVKGGANLANKNLITPKGVVTEVSDEDLALLEANELFQRHKKNGFIIVSQTQADPEKVAQDMTAQDDSAPIREDDPRFDQEDAAKPKKQDAPKKTGVLAAILGKKDEQSGE